MNDPSVQVHNNIVHIQSVNSVSTYKIEEVKIWPCENVKNAENLTSKSSFIEQNLACKKKENLIFWQLNDVRKALQFYVFICRYFNVKLMVFKCDLLTISSLRFANFLKIAFVK